MWNANLTCSCHNLDCCPDYENWCSEQQALEDWYNMTVDEQMEIITSNAAWTLTRNFGSILVDEPF